MKTGIVPKLLAAITLGSGLIFSGCSAAKQRAKVDWSQRVGSYTYQQVVDELGFPAEVKKQDDGKVVAEWIVRTHTAFGLGASVGTSPDAFLHRAQAPREEVLVMTFDPEGRLIEWRRYWR